MIIKKINSLKSPSGDPEDDIFEQLILLQYSLKKMKYFEIENKNPQFSLAMDSFERQFIKLCSFIDCEVENEI